MAARLRTADRNMIDRGVKNIRPVCERSDRVLARRRGGTRGTGTWGIQPATRNTPIQSIANVQRMTFLNCSPLDVLPDIFCFFP